MNDLRPAITTGLAVMLLVSGCVIPIPRQGFVDTRANVPSERPTYLVEGVTNRAEVLMRLGDPDGRAPDGSWFVYGAREHRGGVAFVAGGGGAVGGIAFDNYLYRRLIVTFDSDGVVAGATFEDKPCVEGSFAAGMSVGRPPPPCLDLTGADWEAMRAEAAAKQAEPELAPEPVVATAQHVFWTPRPHDRWSPAGLVVWGSVDVTSTSLLVRGKEEKGGEATKVLLRLRLADIAATHCQDDWMAPKAVLAVQRRNGGPLELYCVESDSWFAMGDADTCSRMEAAIRAGMKGGP